MTMDTSDDEGHHVDGSAVNTSSVVSTTIHGDAREPDGCGIDDRG